MAGCEQRENCPFYKKMNATQIHLHRVYVEDYCRGAFARDCLRRVHQEIYGEPPCDELAPSGLILKMC